MSRVQRVVRAWPWLAGAMLLVFLLVQVLQPEVVEVERAEVVRAPMRVTLDEEGRTRVRDVFTLTTPVAGTVSRIVLEPGDRVARGQVVATVRPALPALLDARSRAELAAQVQAAQSALEQVQADQRSAAAEARLAEAELRRMRPLVPVGAIAPATLEAHDVRVRTATAREQAAEFAVRVAAHRLEAAQAAAALAGPTDGRTQAPPLSLRAPVDGTVLRRLRVSEGVVPAGEGLVDIGDVSTLEIVADYLSADAVQLREGTPVLIEQWGGPSTLEGRVRRIEPSGFSKISALGVEEQRVNVVIVPEGGAEAWQGLGDGYRVEVRAIVWEAADVLAVPLGSVFREGDGWALFVAASDRAERRAVRIGRQSDRMVQILDGVQAGEEVVVHPADQVADGSHISGVRPASRR